MNKYYETIFTSSGELPERSEYYHVIVKDDDRLFPEGRKDMAWFNKHTNEFQDWRGVEVFEHRDYECWLKPIELPEPKQEALEFAEWLCGTYDTIGSGNWAEYNEGCEPNTFTTKELYEKFKEERELTNKCLPY